MRKGNGQRVKEKEKTSSFCSFSSEEMQSTERIVVVV